MLKAIMNGIVTLSAVGTLMLGTFSHTVIDVQENKPGICIRHTITEDNGFTHSKYEVRYFDGSDPITYDGLIVMMIEK